MADLTIQEEQACKNCGHKFKGKFCNKCGEKVITDHDKSVIHFFEEAFHFLTHFEGKFLTTFKTIFTRPGKISDDYCDGIRKPYFKPLSFFMLLVIVYLLFPLLSGLNMELKFYFNMLLLGDDFKQMVDAKIAASSSNLENFSELFHHKSEKVSKLLLIIYIPFAAILLKGFFYRGRNHFFDYLIVATEFCSFYIMFTYFILPGLLYLVFAVSFGGFNNVPEAILFYITILVIMMYSLIAFSRFFKQKRWIVFVKLFGFLPLFFFLVFILYKWILFYLTMAMIG